MLLAVEQGMRGQTWLDPKIVVTSVTIGAEVLPYSKMGQLPLLNVERVARAVWMFRGDCTGGRAEVRGPILKARRPHSTSAARPGSVGPVAVIRGGRCSEDRQLTARKHATVSYAA